MRQSPAMRICQAALAVLAWFALATQFYLIIIHRAMPVLDTVIQYFSYFTILTNLLVAICFTFLLLKPRSPRGQYFSQATVATAITVYITIVGLIYNVVLRSLWTPTGWQFITDELLHSIIPALCILYWLLFVPKGELKWTRAFRWLLYPLLYCIYILVRGAFSGLYPYPFVDVNILGYAKTIYHCSLLCGAFVMVSLLFIGIDRLMGKALSKK